MPTSSICRGPSAAQPRRRPQPSAGDDEGLREEGRPRLDRRETPDPLEVQRAEEERRRTCPETISARTPHATMRLRRRMMFTGRIGLAMRFSRRGRPRTARPPVPAADRPQRPEAVLLGADDRVDRDHRGHRDQRRAQDVEVAAHARAAFAGEGDLAEPEGAAARSAG